MRILIDIRHSTHVHYFAHLVRELEKRGNELLVTSHSRNGVEELLSAAGIEHVNISRSYPTALGIAASTAVRTWRMHGIARRFRPDVLVACGGAAVGAVGKLMRRPAVTFDDVEDALEQVLLQRCLSTLICTGMGYARSLGPKHRRLNTVFHFVRTHPTRFRPDPDVLRGEGLEPEEPYVVIRLTAWLAMHDIGCTGLGEEEVSDIVDALSEHARVVISAEGEIPRSLAGYASPISAGNVFHLLAFARLLIGEGASMPAEAACLGTPAIWVSRQRRGYLKVLEKRYGLVERLTDLQRIKERAREFLTDLAVRARVEEGHRRFLAETVDPLALMVQTIDELGRRSARRGRRRCL